MDKIGGTDYSKVISEAKSTSLYPMLFGVSCAFAALDFMSKQESHDESWWEVRNRMLQGSAHLLGLLVWRIQKEESKNEKSDILLKLENAQRQMEELKKRRSEDAKANEKVVSIFANQEQGWFNERKKLRQQIEALVNELRALEAKKDKVISDLNEKLQEKELSFQSKDRSLKEDQQKRQELEEKLKNAEEIVEELKETLKREAQRHSAEIGKQKTAFEAEMSQALGKFEAAKEELGLVLEQKEESVFKSQKLSMELVKMRKDTEQKDQILSAMLRKSKQDTTEKEALLKEVKLSKSKRKQAEVETDRWKHETVSLKSIFSKHTSFQLDASSRINGLDRNGVMPLDAGIARKPPINHFREHKHQKSRVVFSTTSDLYLNKRNGELIAEQLRLKDEKLESFHGRLLSMELESKRLQSHIEGLNHGMAQLRQDKMDLKALLLNREEELCALREDMSLQLSPPNCQRTNLNPSLHDPALVPDIAWSKVEIIKRKLGQKVQEMKTTDADIYTELEINKGDVPSNNQLKDIVLTLRSPEKKEEGKAPRSGQEKSSESDDFKNSQLVSVGQSASKNIGSGWRMDLHALGVSYKIKRLKQQLVMLERLTGKQENSAISERNDKRLLKGLYALLSLLNKQVGRYQSLQAKIDDICKGMHNHDLASNYKRSKIRKTDQETKLLEHFLEETFQLQRYIVATGQKLMEVKAKITSGPFSSAEVLDRPASFDVKRFSDGIRNLLSEVQRGLEVRIARIIGDLEGPLASDGFVHMRR